MKNKKGFTLVELLVVIAILAILATVSIVGYTGFIKKAKESNATVELTQIRDLMIAADIDDSVVCYKGATDVTETNFLEDTYYTKTGNKYEKATSFATETTYYTKSGARTNLSDGLNEEEAIALWEVIKKDCEGLKGELKFKTGTLYYKLDDAVVSYKFGDNAAFNTNDVTVPEGAVQINTAE